MSKEQLVAAYTAVRIARGHSTNAEIQLVLQTALNGLEKLGLERGWMIVGN